MGDCGCAKLVKWLFFTFNFIFWVLGIAVLGVGIASRVENDSWNELVDSDTFFAAANLLIAAGVFVAILGFLGCCGAIKEWRWMLIIYTMIVVIIFILEIAGGAYAYAKRDLIEEKLVKGITNAVKMNYGDKTNTAAKGFTKAIDWFQQKVECCGVDNAGTWRNSDWYKHNPDDTIQKEFAVPDSCCKTEKENCGRKLTGPLDSKIYQKGCIEKGKQYAKDNLYLIGGVGIGIAIVQLLSIAFAIGLICSFKEGDGETA